MRRRVITTPVERVDVVLAELGTWAGAIGAAVHGAERAAGAERGGWRMSRARSAYSPRYREIEIVAARRASPRSDRASGCPPTPTSAPSSGSAA